MISRIVQNQIGDIKIETHKLYLLMFGHDNCLVDESNKDVFADIIYSKLFEYINDRESVLESIKKSLKKIKVEEVGMDDETFY